MSARGVTLGLILAVAVAWLTPLLFGVGWLTTFTSTAITVIAIAGVGILYGEVHLTSLTQAALMGVGAWVTLRLFFAFGWPLPVLVLAAAVATGAIGLLIGLPALRLRGLYLGVVTLVMAGAFDIVFNAIGFPNGGTGFTGYQASGELQVYARPELLAGDATYFRFVIVILTGTIIVLRMHLRGRVGRAWGLIRASEPAAVAVGVPVVTMKVWAFVLAGILAGVAGSLTVAHFGQVGPATFSPIRSLVFFALALVAGARRVGGWIIAALLAIALPFLLLQLGVDGSVATIIFGAALILNLVVSPQGIASDLEALGRMLRRRLAAG